MKKGFYFTLIAILLGSIFVFSGLQEDKENYKTLEVGEKAPKIDYKMPSIKGKDYNLKNLKKENGIVVIFSCNTCPFVLAWENRYPKIAQLADQNKLGFALINSNEAKRQADDREDSMEAMKQHAAESGYPDLNYLLDRNSNLANAFGAKTTPHVFLFNENLELVYEGAIDDNFKDASAVENQFLQDAIINLSNGNKIEPNNTKAIGCSIKRV